LKKLLFAIGLFALAPVAAHANQTPVATYCSPVNNIHNGDPLDAIPLMADFNFLSGCALNAGDIFNDGALYSTTFSYSSSSLSFTFPANVFIAKGARAYMAANSQTATANSTNYYWVDSQGVVRSTLSNSAPTSTSALIYTVVTNSSGVTAVTPINQTNMSLANGLTASTFNPIGGTSYQFNTVASQAFNIVGSASNGVATFNDTGSFALSNGAIHADASGNFAANSATLIVPLALGSGGTGTNAPALIAGTGIAITGQWPNNTISFTGGTGLAQQGGNNTFSGSNYFSGVTNFGNQVFLNPANTATSGTNYNSQQLTFQNSTYSSGGPHTNNANIYLSTDGNIVSSTGIEAPNQSNIGGVNIVPSSSTSLPGVDIRSDGTNVFMNPANNGQISLGYDTSALGGIRYGPGGGWGTWTSSNLNIATPATINGTSFISGGTGSGATTNIRSDGNNIFINPNGSYGIGLGNDDSSITGVTFGPSGSWGTWNGTTLAANGSASVYNTLTVGHNGTNIRAFSSGCGTFNMYSSGSSATAGVTTSGQGFACGDGGATLLSVDQSGNLGVFGAESVNGSLTVGISGGGELNQIENGYSSHQFIDSSDNLGWYDATHSHASGVTLNLNTGALTAGSLTIPGNSALHGTSVTSLTNTGAENVTGNITFGNVTTGGTLNASTGNINISGNFHAGSNGSQTIGGALQWGVDQGGYTYATIASNDGSCPNGVCANIEGLFRSDGTNLRSLDYSGNESVIGNFYAGSLNTSGNLNAGGTIFATGQISSSGNISTSATLTASQSVLAGGAIIGATVIAATGGTYSQTLPVLWKGASFENSPNAHSEVISIGGGAGTYNFTKPFDAAPICFGDGSGPHVTATTTTQYTVTANGNFICFGT
jgi:hypothetical protein